MPPSQQTITREFCNGSTSTLNTSMPLLYHQSRAPRASRHGSRCTQSVTPATDKFLPYRCCCCCWRYLNESFHQRQKRASAKGRNITRKVFYGAVRYTTFAMRPLLSVIAFATRASRKKDQGRPHSTSGLQQQQQQQQPSLKWVAQCKENFSQVRHHLLCAVNMELCCLEHQQTANEASVDMFPTSSADSSGCGWLQEENTCKYSEYIGLLEWEWPQGGTSIPLSFHPETGVLPETGIALRV